MDKIRIGIAGYGNVGRGVEKAVMASDDMELSLVLTRRSPDSVKPLSGVRTGSLSCAADFSDSIDVLVLCGGSASDLPVQGPELASLFNTVDSFDTHARIPEYLASVDAAARASGKLSLISCGWDPGLFSIMRALGGAVLPDGRDYTFWGRGVSQGHSDAIRRVPGVKNAIQYTVPVDEAVSAVRSGAMPDLTVRQKHTRLCYVVAEDGADKAAIEQAIVNMPNYFSDYDTTVNFISEEELKANHSAMPHGGFVFRNGHTGENAHSIEFSLKLESNPEFTGSVLAACARAVHRLHSANTVGAITMLDVPPAALSPMPRAELIKKLL